MIDSAILIAAWMIGASFSMAALATMGEASGDTYGDSYSGDDSLDLLLITLWPIFWPCWTAFRLGRWLFTTETSETDGDANG